MIRWIQAIFLINLNVLYIELVITQKKWKF